MAKTQINGSQVKDATIAAIDIAASGTPSATTFFRGDNTWSVPTDPETSSTNLAPTATQTLISGYSVVVPRRYKLASGLKLVLGSASIFRIL